MQISIEWSAPKLELRVDDGAFLRRVTEEMARAVLARTSAGLDYLGAPLHAPKDAGKKDNPSGVAMNRTGQLLASIVGVVEGDTGWVRCEGRQEEERSKTIHHKGRLIHEKQKFKFGYRTYSVRTGKTFRTGAGTVQRRIHERIGTIAAILERPGKGKHAGARPEMIILRTTDEEIGGIVERSVGELRAELVQVGETTGSG